MIYKPLSVITTLLTLVAGIILTATARPMTPAKSSSQIFNYQEEHYQVAAQLGAAQQINDVTCSPWLLHAIHYENHPGVGSEHRMASWWI